MVYVEWLELSRLLRQTSKDWASAVMTWQGHGGRVGLSEERPNPIRQDRSNRDEISEWRPALPRQPHESRDMDLDGSQIQRTHGISDPTDNHTFLSRNKDYRISIYSYAPSLP